MIQTSITDLSNNLKTKVNDFILDYPMGSYIPVWKIFRAFSHENEIISTHIKSTDTWNNGIHKNIFDVGCGDGLVLKHLIANEKKEFSLTLVEPNIKLIDEACANLEHINYLDIIPKDLFSLNFDKLLNGLDLILMVHVLYLLEINSLSKLVEIIPNNTSIILVTDENNSLFTECWDITAPKFAKRSRNIHVEINRLQKLGVIEVKRSTFKTLIKDPFTIHRKDLKETLLSMITYSDFNSLHPDQKIEINQLFDKNKVEDVIECKSVCYEIKKIVA